jgi:hypothetical protein
MAAPPLLVDCVKVTVACPVPAVAVPMVGAVATVGEASKAPLSYAVPSGRAVPRWSVALPVGARSRAGLYGCNEIVCVGPPLLASGFSNAAPTKLFVVVPVTVQPDVVPITLKLFEVSVPAQSLPEGAVLPAMMERSKATVPLCWKTPPAEVLAVLLATVTCVSESVPFTPVPVAIAPPLTRPVLPEKVLLVMVNAWPPIAPWKMAPPVAAELPVNVLLLIASVPKFPIAPPCPTVPLEATLLVNVLSESVVLPLFSSAPLLASATLAVTARRRSVAVVPPSM